MKLILIATVFGAMVGIYGCQTQNVIDKPHVLDALFSEQDLQN